MTNTNLKNNFLFYLDDDLSIAGTSVAITDDVETGSSVEISDPADVTLISDDGSTVERMIITATGGIMTIVQRGIKNDNSGTSDNALKKARWPNQLVFLTIFSFHLASLSSSNTYTGSNSWTGTSNFVGVVNMSNVSDFNVNGMSNPWPVVADITARDLLYPFPLHWDKVNVIGIGDQTYNSGTAQWETFGIQTPPPYASTSVAWLVKIGTSFANPDQVGWLYYSLPISVIKSYVDTGVNWKISFLDNQFMAGEVIPAGQYVVPEILPTFALATTVWNIWDATGNTRRNIRIISTGTYSSTFKLSLKKFVSPSSDLHIRLETDDGTGKPSGTPVDAVNAVATVTSASLTTSLADTTCTWAWTFTQPAAGTVLHYVLYVGTYGSETINSTNYYGLGYSTKDTTTRWTMVYDWFNRNWSTNPITLANINNATNAPSASYGVRFSVSTNTTLISVDKSASSTATRCRLLNQAGSLLATGTVVSNTATFNYTLTSWTQYRIEWDNSGAAYTNAYIITGSNPSTVWILTVTIWSGNGADDAWFTNANVASMTFSSTTGKFTTIFPYISSTSVQDKVLTLTDSDFTYKVDTLGCSTETVAIWWFPKITTIGTNNNQTWLTNNMDYFLSGTPGAISTTPWTIQRRAGTAKWATSIWVPWFPERTVIGTNLILFSLLTSRTTQSTSYVLKKSVTIPVSGMITTSLTINSSNNSWVTFAQIYRNGVAYWTERNSGGDTLDHVFTENLQFQAWDILDIYLKISNATRTATLKDCFAKFNAITNSILTGYNTTD